MTIAGVFQSLLVGGGTPKPTLPSSGALLAGSAVVSGIAGHMSAHIASGALIAGSAVIAGVAGHGNVHAATGALVAGSAAVAGVAGHGASHTSTGALAAGSATVSGIAAHISSHPSTGALAAGSAIVAGTAGHASAHPSTGALTAGSAVIAGTAAHTGDPFFADVVLLLHGDGTNDSTTIIDSSSYAHTMTAAGNAKLKTAVKQFGTASINIPNAASSTADNVVGPSSAVFEIPGDFTFEMFFRTSDNSQVSQHAFVLSDVDQPFWVGYGSSVANRFSANFRTQSASFRADSTGALNSNQFYYIGITLSGTTLSLYIDGALQNTATVSGTRFTGATTPRMGSPLAYGINGYLDEVRLTIGVARNVSSIPTGPFLDY